ncbi:hypothetical protein S40288_10192 [Stachybotrys chartarum IBT 40288]|nr:hypothetical protein S40288_10192 [Stachybotrys chartarum IBT 40288]
MSSLKDKSEKQAASILQDYNQSRTTVVDEGATEETWERDNQPQLEQTQQDPGDGPEPVYPRGLKLLLIGASLVLAVMCMALDQSILSTATPKITAEFNSLGDIGWYGSAYLLTTCGFQLMFGKLYNECNMKWTFLAAVLIFEVGSVICAAAPSSIILIVGRAVAGLGGAGIFVGALLIITKSVPVVDRPKFTGIMGGCSSVAQVIAPFLGGWCFWINLPLGGITIIVTTLFLSIPENQARPKKTALEFLKIFDVLGALFFFPAIVSLLLALQWGGTQYPWGHWKIVLLLCVFGSALIAWVFVQSRLGDNATLPLRIIGRRSMAAAAWISFTFSGAVLVVIQYVPLWFQAVKGISAYESGIDFLAASGPMAVSAIASGFLISAIGYFNPIMYISTAFAAAAAGMMYRYWIDTSTAYWVISLILFGLGAGLGVQCPLMVPSVILEAGDIALGTSLVVFAQTISGTIFLSVGNNILNDRLIANLKADVPQVDPAKVVEAGAGELESTMQQLYPEYVAQIVESYGKALQNVFLVVVCLAVAIFFGVACVEWKSIHSKKDKKGSGIEMVMV